jgi:hypothetical protein
MILDKRIKVINEICVEEKELFDEWLNFYADASLKNNNRGIGWVRIDKKGKIIKNLILKL